MAYLQLCGHVKLGYVKKNFENIKKLTHFRFFTSAGGST